MNTRAEHRLRVRTIHADRVEFELATRCDGCGACSGRCSGVLSGLHVPWLGVPRARLPADLAVGDSLLLRADAAALARRSASIHAAALAGLLLGAAIGALLAHAGGWPSDPLVAVGAPLGVLGALRLAALYRATSPPAFHLVPLPSPTER
jgi:ferredoxin